MKNLIIAVDFDNTIARVSRFPDIDGIFEEAREAINEWASRGHFIIVNTCRSGKHQTQAKEWLDRMGVHYDLINENHPALVDFFEDDCRKISADIYIDDKDPESIYFGYVDWERISFCVKLLEISQNPSMIEGTQ